MFTQVQVYKYLSSLSFDVLVYCLIESLAAPDKVRRRVITSSTLSFHVNVCFEHEYS